jgi:GntR family transcriptional regulator
MQTEEDASPVKRALERTGCSVLIMSIDHDDVRAPYLQLADILRGRIADGTIEPGRCLPSLMDLEREFGLNPKTIRKALGLLKSEGLIESSPGRGMFVKAAGPQGGAEGGA